MMPMPDREPTERERLRQRLLAERDAFAATPEFDAAERAASRHLDAVLRQLEPKCLGLYWPVRSEFNARRAWDESSPRLHPPWALPFAYSADKRMEYRRWDGAAPSRRDACGIPSSDGEPVLPDVVLVPCVGYTASGWRLGYGGGYFDRWLARHPQVTAIGVAWSRSRLDDAVLAAEPHDLALAIVVTEAGVERETG